MDPNKLLVWAQVGGQMVQIIAAGVDGVKKLIAESGATDEDKKAALDRTNTLYELAIAHEEEIRDGKATDQ